MGPSRPDSLTGKISCALARPSGVLLNFTFGHRLSMFASHQTELDRAVTWIRPRPPLRLALLAFPMHKDPTEAL